MSPANPVPASRGPKHAPRVPFAVLVVGLIGGGLALLLALNTASAANELRRHDLASRDVGIAADVQQLQVDVAASAAPDNLAVAAAALGMVPAVNPAFLQVGADGSVHVLGSPAAASAPPLVKAKPKQKAHATTHATTSTSGKPSPGATSSSSAPAHGRGSTTPGGHGSTTTHPSTTTPTGTSTRTSGATPGSSSSTTPTSTPTPTVTLPGGTR